MPSYIRLGLEIAKSLYRKIYFTRDRAYETGFRAACTHLNRSLQRLQVYPTQLEMRSRSASTVSSSPARKNRLCKANPAEDISLTRDPAKPPKVHTLEEVRAILTYAPSHKWGLMWNWPSIPDCAPRSCAASCVRCCLQAGTLTIRRVECRGSRTTTQTLLASR